VKGELILHLGGYGGAAPPCGLARRDPDSVTINRASDGTGVLRNHLNCGIIATLKRDGGIKAILEPFPIPLGSTNALSAALIVAAFLLSPPNRPVASSWPAARANDAVGKAKTTNKKATFTEVFDIGKLHKNAPVYSP
jgi:hypothetical protein